MSLPAAVPLDEDGLRAAVPAWIELWHRVDGPVFQHPAWALGVPMTGTRLGYAVWSGPTLRGLLVLAILPEGARFAGHPLNDGNEVLAQDHDARSALVRTAAAANPSSLRLELLDEDGPTMATIRRDRRIVARWHEPEPCPILPIGTTPDVRLAKRLKRELSQMGSAIEIALAPPTVSDVERFVDRRLQVWQERGRLHDLGPVERHPAFPAAMGRACGGLASAGLCKMATLRVDGRLVAEDLYLGTDHRPLLFMRRYEKGSGLESPGLQLAAEVRRTAGLGDINLGRGDEPYKARLGARAREVWTADLSLAAEEIDAGGAG